ncbi:hypothetical protein TanjilG_06366 [Lupinus angustifolius]|uniref:K+ potassium transporter integral membrane domain-containing protein n=1 Tax=Lupinus angustifolius TaxID=3871 RepID=A0A394DEC5_LUPAN|nr:hypothetical protein TanjilG_06366 [Lupinus angustifolius]
MAEEERDTERGSSMDSTESRWVFQEDEDASEIDDFDGDSPMIDSEDEENGEHRLIRTGPRIDSFDVEALEVPGAHRSDYEDISTGKRIVLVFQTLGVVFGDVGTSPLYTFSVMFRKAPINGNEDILGALSLVLYTLILIPLLKYVLVVLRANDDGEGGTFALYSLICRNAKVSLLPNQLSSDTRISGFRLKVPSPELERSLKIKERLETSLTLKKILLLLVLAGTSMVIANGAVTPAMSVLSSVNGLKVGVDAIGQDEVVMISVAFLVILFSVQKYGTSKVGLFLGPALFIWFCSLAGIGIYNLVKYDSSVLRAFNPIYIFYFFARNSTKAWYSLGGCLLCATGSEAMFADLCYFSVRSVQLTFVFLVLPCLILGYLGQAAYLMENHADAGQAFFSSVPSGAFWPTLLIANIAALIASRAMTTATFSCIKQSTALGCFPRLKIIHTSRKFMGQIYIPVINWFLLAVSLVFVCSISSFDEIGNAYAIHSMIIFVSIKYVPIAVVPQSERFLFRRVCQKSYHIFRCIARYGYKDVRKENHQTFEQLLMESLEKFIRREAQEKSLESDRNDDSSSEDEYSGSRVLIAPNGSVYSLGVPLLADFTETNIPIFEASTSEDVNPQFPNPPVLDAEQSLERELSFIRKAKESGIVYLVGHADIRARKDSWFMKKLVINYFYAFLRKNCRRGIANLSVPHSHLMQVGMTYMV